MEQTIEELCQAYMRLRKEDNAEATDVVKVIQDYGRTVNPADTYNCPALQEYYNWCNIVAFFHQKQEYQLCLELIDSFQGALAASTYWEDKGLGIDTQIEQLKLKVAESDDELEKLHYTYIFAPTTASLATKVLKKRLELKPNFELAMEILNNYTHPGTCDHLLVLEYMMTLPGKTDEQITSVLQLTTEHIKAEPHPARECFEG